MSRLRVWRQLNRLQYSRTICTTSSLCEGKNPEEKQPGEKEKGSETERQSFWTKFLEKSGLSVNPHFKLAQDHAKTTLHRSQEIWSNVRRRNEQTVNDQEKAETQENLENEDASSKTAKRTFIGDKFNEYAEKTGLSENPYFKQVQDQVKSTVHRTRQILPSPRRREKKDPKTEEEMPEVETPSSIRSKFNEYLEKSGLSENPQFKQAQDQAKSTLHKTQDLKAKLSKMVSSSIAEQVEDLGKKVDEGKSAVEKSGILEKSKEAFLQSEKMAKEALEQSEKLAKEAAERIAHEKEELVKSEKFKKISEVTSDTVKTATDDFYDPVRLKESANYRSPEQLKKRIEEDEAAAEELKAAEARKRIKVDEETTGMTMHKGWTWETTWRDFKDKNPIVQKFMQFRETLEESDHIFARAGYRVVDFMTNGMNKMTKASEVSQTIEEIQKMDPTFDINAFSATLRFDIVPHVLEAYLQGNVEILENWSQERALGQFKHMLAAREFKGTIKLVDIGECEILTGVMLELGPVFMFNVSTQQLFSKKVTKKVENGEGTQDVDEQIKQVIYTIAVCRDQSMLDPTAAWTILEIVENVTNENFF